MCTMFLHAVTYDYCKADYFADCLSLFTHEGRDQSDCIPVFSVGNILKGHAQLYDCTPSPFSVLEQ